LVSSERSLRLVFLINLVEDKNVTLIFYKLSQTCATETNDDTYLGTEGVSLGHPQPFESATSSKPFSSIMLAFNI
jgi:hypothetical protein